MESSFIQHIWHFFPEKSGIIFKGGFLPYGFVYLVSFANISKFRQKGKQTSLLSWTSYFKQNRIKIDGLSATLYAASELPRILKRSLNSMVSPTVHSSNNHSLKWRCSKNLFKVEQFGITGFFDFALRKQFNHDKHVIFSRGFLVWFSSNRYPKWPVIVAFLKFLRLSGDGKHLMRLLSETSVFKFLRRGVNMALACNSGERWSPFLMWFDSQAIYVKSFHVSCSPIFC